MAQVTQSKKGDLMIVTVDVTTGKVIRVDGVEKENVKSVINTLEQLKFPAAEVDCKEVAATFYAAKTDNCAVILHTHSSPGCGWVMQDGWWRWVCN